MLDRTNQKNDLSEIPCYSTAVKQGRIYPMGSRGPTSLLGRLLALELRNDEEALS